MKCVVWENLCKTAKLKCTVVTQRNDRLKANTASSSRESLENLEIHRFDSAMDSSEVLSTITNLALEVRPDIIFCAVDLNMPIARVVQRETDAPICLHTEYFLDTTQNLKRELIWVLTGFDRLSTNYTDPNY